MESVFTANAVYTPKQTVAPFWLCRREQVRLLKSAATQRRQGNADQTHTSPAGEQFSEQTAYRMKNNSIIVCGLAQCMTPCHSFKV